MGTRAQHAAASTTTAPDGSLIITGATPSDISGQLIGVGTGLARVLGLGDLLPGTIAGIPVGDATPDTSDGPGFLDRLQTMETIGAVVVGLVVLAIVAMAAVYIIHTVKSF